MMKQIDHPAEHVVATKANGTLTSFDHENLLTPALDAALKNHEKISWYFEMEDFTGWEPGALWMTSHTV